jgi:hypothetical protein
LSRLKGFSEVKPEIFFGPMSVTEVQERLMLADYVDLQKRTTLRIVFETNINYNIL